MCKHNIIQTSIVYKLNEYIVHGCPLKILSGTIFMIILFAIYNFDVANILYKIMSGLFPLTDMQQTPPPQKCPISRFSVAMLFRS